MTVGKPLRHRRPDELRALRSIPSQLLAEAPSVRVCASYRRSDTIVLTVAGAVDASTVHQFQDVLGRCLAVEVRTIVVDLTRVDFLGVAGLQLLTQAHMDTQAHCITLRIVAAGQEVPHVLRTAGLDAVLDCHPTLSAALKSDQERLR